jgi:muramoyltetrapeptide carboxypeptidase
VRPGDRIGVAALSGPVDPERLARGMAALSGLGFEPVPAANLGETSRLFAGDDRRRLDAFHRLAADPSLKAIAFARGGHGVLRLLPEIDWELLAAHPRAYLGYSDLTPFLLAVTARLGLVAFHGPMVAADLARGISGEEAASLLAALAGEYPRAYAVEGVIAGGGGEPAAGPLLGGCLSLIAALLGTAHLPDLAGAVLFWEDVDEPLYRLDRMLTHLKLSGSLAALSAMVVGHAEPTDARGEPAAVWLADALAGFSPPLAWGLAAGHRAPNLTLPLGLTARLEPAARRLICGEG